MAALAVGLEPYDPDRSDVLSALAGDGKAFARLVHRHEHSLVSHLRRFTDNEAALQDLRQETCLEAYRSLSTYRSQGPFSNWLRRIASRVGYRYWSGQVREVRAKGAYLELQRDRASAPSARYEHDAIECARALFACLDHYDRTLLEMRYVQGLKATEIARSMGWKAVRVRVRLHRTLKKLRNLHGAHDQS